jgi:hypothetical protein
VPVISGVDLRLAQVDARAAGLCCPALKCRMPKSSQQSATPLGPVVCCFCGATTQPDSAIELAFRIPSEEDAWQQFFAHARCFADRLAPEIPHLLLPDDTGPG